MKDLIIGCIQNYAPSQVACWINSIKACGFDGDVVVIEFGIPIETVRFLESKGVIIHSVRDHTHHIVVDRFAAIYSYLVQNPDYRYVIATDVKDVIFQSNPFNILENAFDDSDYYERNPYGIYVGSENIIYEYEDWGRVNMQTSYPHMYEFMKDKEIYNAGTIGGTAEAFRDFCLAIYHLSLIGGDPQPDQAAMNILIHTRGWEDITYQAGVEDGWSINLGTELPKYKGLFSQNRSYFWDGDKIREDASEYDDVSIVHQYDRVPDLKEKIENKFGSID